MIDSTATCSFFIDGRPVPKGRPRFVSGSAVYTPEKTRKYEKKVQVYMLKYRTKIFEDAVLLTLRFLLQRTMRNKRKYPTVRPDLDNLIKAVKDAGNGIMWKDDAQVCKIIATKEYVTENMGVWVTVETME